jgi:hypothetical protein
VSGKLCHAYPVDPLPDDDLSVLAVANVAAKFSVTSFPSHLIASTPGGR